MEYLKQSTAATIKLGPFLDDTDGKTAETGLTIAQADIKLTKNGGTFAQTNNAAGATHDAAGWYGIPLNTTDTGTLGRLTVAVHETGALPCFAEFMVVPVNVFDSLFGSDKLEVDLLQIGGVAQSATDLKDFADAGYDPATNKVQGVVLVDTTTTNTDMISGFATSTALATVDSNVDAILVDTGTTLPATLSTIDGIVDSILVDTTGLNGEAMRGTDSAATATALATVDGIVDSILTDTGTTLPATLTDMAGATFATGTDSLEAIRNRGDAEWVTGAGGSAPTVGEIADAVWDEAISGHTTGTTFGGKSQKVVPSETLADYKATGFSTLTTAQVNTEVDSALSDIHLDHLLAVDYDPASKPGTATALLNELIENDGGISRYTANALEQAPSGTGASAVSIRQEMDSNSTRLAAIETDTTGINGDAMRGTDSASTLTAAQVNTEVDIALADIHLDHLLAVNYDPAVKPGTATALLNELIENDGGISRYSANALEQAPSGTGASAVSIRQEMDNNSTRLAAIETDTTGINGAVMRGTDSAATATALATVDSNVDAILVDTGTTIPGTITTVDANVDAILVDTGTTLPATLATIDGIVDNILIDTGTTIPGTITTAQNDLNVITGSDGVTLATAQALYAPNKTVPDVAGTASGLHSTTNGLVNTIDTVVDAIYAIANSGVHGNSALKTLIDALPATSDINAQVADVLKTDTVAEMTQGSPPASPTMEQILNYMYRALRNKIQTTATETAVYNDAGSAKLIKATVSDDATTFTKNEYVSGA